MSKKIYLLLSIAFFAFTLSSCSKNQCKNCTNAAEPDCTIVVCNNTITYVGNCNSGQTNPINTAGMTNDEISDTLKTLGWECIRP
jgi:hypothetical protein